MARRSVARADGPGPGVRHRFVAETEVCHGMVRDERGIALLIVVAVIAMLTIVVTEFTYSVTLDQYRVRNSLHALQAELIVRSGINLAEGFLSLDEDASVDTYTDEWFFAMKNFCAKIPLPDGSVAKCDVKDESGKININNTRTRAQSGALTGSPTKQDYLSDALRCIFQRQEGLEVEIVDDLRDYWRRDPPTLPDGNQRRKMPSFQSIEAFVAEFNIPTKQIPYLRKYLTAQPPRRLRGVNINIAEPEVLGAIINSQDPGTKCGRTQVIEDILDRQLDPDNPIKDVDVAGLLSGIEGARTIASLFVTHSSLYRLEASAITNPNPDNPTSSGIGKTLSVLVFRECVEENGGTCERWTSRPLDWQKESGARLFREKNRFSGLSEYYGEFDPSALGDLFN